MPVTALYRINGGEVLKISVKGQPFSDRNTTYWGVLTDPTLPDGNAVRETLADGTLGPLRVLGYAKIAVPASNTARNATQAEIDLWAAAESVDDNAQDAERVDQLITTHPVWKKVFRAIVRHVEDRMSQPPGQVRSESENIAALRGHIRKDD